MLSTFADSGLERATALEKDIAWFKEEGLEAPPLGSFGKAYAKRLREIAAAGEWEVTYPNPIPNPNPNPNPNPMGGVRVPLLPLPLPSPSP